MQKTILVACFAVYALQNAQSAAQPNFVIIFTDDQGYQDLGCYGSQEIKTPNIDRMAEEGMRFTSFYAQTVCGPSRAALMTGCYPLRVAQRNNAAEIHPRLHTREITIAEILKEQGYATACLGKWDLAGHTQDRFSKELMPNDQGFDYFFGTPSSNDNIVNLFRNGQMVEAKADISTLTKRYTDEAIQFIGQSKDRPFFVYLAHTMPHTKLSVSKQFKGRSKGGLYGDVIEEIDFNVGRILDCLKELGLDDSTYVIFTSDNGPWWKEGDHGGHALPLRGAKTTCWEGGLRVPCVVRAPGRIPAGTECDLVTATIDVLPTLAKLAGGRMPRDRVIDGVDISDVIHGKTVKLERAYYYYQHTNLRAVRSGRWKLMLAHMEDPRRSIATRWRSHIRADDAIRLEKDMLFDVNVDISERKDVSAANPDVVKELLQLAKWAKDDIGDYDRLGRNARFFDTGPRRVSATKGPAGRRPNVIIILADDLGCGDISLYDGWIKTPRIDQMAREGVRFTDFHSNGSVCSPTRVAFLTGRYQQRVGIVDVIVGYRDKHGLESSEITIPRLMKGAGYRTAIFGKWHCGTDLRHNPTNHGFDEFVGFLTGAGDYHKHGNWMDGKRVKQQEGYSTHIITERSVDFIKRNKDYPFFLYVSHAAVHNPYQTPADTPENRPQVQQRGREHVRPKYRIMLEELDKGVGRILDTLKECTLEENTFVFFFSDNGAVHMGANVRPYRGGKFSNYEGGHRVPAVARWPGHIKAGWTSDELTVGMDLLPTIMDIVGIDISQLRKVDGTSMKNHLLSQADLPDRRIFFGYEPKLGTAMRDGHWKIQTKGDVVELYDLSKDIKESTNVGDQYPERTKEMKAAIEKWKLEVAPQTTSER